MRGAPSQMADASVFLGGHKSHGDEGGPTTEAGVRPRLRQTSRTSTATHGRGAAPSTMSSHCAFNSPPVQESY